MYTRAAAAATAALVGTGALFFPTTTASAQHENVVVVGHRGASAYAPENTLESVDKAHALGIDWVENDVQRTKDGHLVVLHDASLKRTTNVQELYPGRAPWNVRDFTAAEIAKLDAGRWKGPEFAGAHVPTLKDYLNRVDANHQSLLLEIKNPELYPGIERDILQELGRDRWLNKQHLDERLIVQSFGVDSVQTVHRLRPDIRTALLGTPSIAKLPAYSEFVDQINPSDSTVSRSYVSLVHAFNGAHGRRLQVYTWTVNDAATARRVADYGVDGVISNVPDAVAKDLREH
ncbi:glycerophosphodiester phosphodiesterase [Streptomyces sp. NPDC002004]